MPIHKLTATKIKFLRDPGRYSDGAGLWLQVAKGGSRSWLFQFKRAGRARQLGLGSLLTVSLADARSRAQKARDELQSGVDPIDAKRERSTKAILVRQLAAPREADTNDVTFERAALEFIDQQASTWRNAKHREQWTSSLSTYAFPEIAKLPVQDVHTSHIIKILQPIWNEKRETASRVRGRIQNVLDAATGRRIASS